MSKAPVPAPTAAQLANIPCIVRDTPVLDCLDENKTYGDFRDDLMRDGYAVIEGVLDQEKCNMYIDQIHEWLESFGLGYNRNDPSTVKDDCLPIIHQKGLVQGYGAPHENFTWGIRSEPAVVAIFEKIFGTEDLLSSFDSVNISLANRKDLPPNKPWPHQDQDPERPGLRCIQGFANLIDCQDNDGGLVVLKGGHKISAEYHEAFKNEPQLFRWTNENYTFQDTGLQWLKERGYEWVKVNCGPGSIVLWDSRTPHYNQSPLGTNNRFVVYTCYYPVALATKEELELKKQLFEDQRGHSHWPMALQPFIDAYDSPVAPKRNGVPDPLNKWKPRKAPQLSERGFKLTGIPYIKSTA